MRSFLLDMLALTLANIVADVIVAAFSLPAVSTPHLWIPTAVNVAVITGFLAGWHRYAPPLTPARDPNDQG